MDPTCIEPLGSSQNPPTLFTHGKRADESVIPRRPQPAQTWRKKNPESQLCPITLRLAPSLTHPKFSLGGVTILTFGSCTFLQNYTSQQARGRASPPPKSSPGAGLQASGAGTRGGGEGGGEPGSTRQAGLSCPELGKEQRGEVGSKGRGL